MGEFRIDYDLPARPGARAPSPPAPALSPWRVWINQERPRQKKNPQWSAVPAKSGAKLDMAPEGHFRCVLTPVSLFAHQESETEVKTWTATRAVRCSSDGFRTNVESRLVVDVSPTGEVTLPPEREPSLLLHDVVAGQNTETVVALAFGSESPRDAGARTQRPQANPTGNVFNQDE